MVASANSGVSSPIWCIVIERAIQQAACLHPVTTNRAFGNVERFGGFLLGHATKEATFYDTGEPSVDEREIVEGFVQFEQSFCLRVNGSHAVIERDAPKGTTTFFRGSATRAINEDVSHRHRCDAQEVRAISPIRVLGVRKFQIQLVHKGGC